MPLVFIPPSLSQLTDGQREIEVEGGNVAELVQNLEEQFPGIQRALCDDGRLKPGLVVSIGNATSHRGLLQPVSVDDEVHFLPAIGGG